MRELATRSRQGEARGKYAVELARTPLAWGSAAFAIGGSLALEQPLGLLLAGVVAIATWVSSAHPALQARIDRARAREGLRKARDARETRLEDAGVSRGQIAALTDIVDEIVAAKLVSLPELEALLDHFAELAIARARLRSVITTALLSETGGTDRTLSSALARRRAAHLEHCRERCIDIEHELQEIERRIRTLGRRATLALS